MQSSHRRREFPRIKHAESPFSGNEPSRQFVNKAPLRQYAEVQKVQSRRGTMFSQTHKPQRPVGLLSDSILRPLFAAYSYLPCACFFLSWAFSFPSWALSFAASAPSL